MWTPELEAEYQTLKAKLSEPVPIQEPQEPEQGTWSRIGQHVGNFMPSIVGAVTRPLFSIAGTLAGDDPDVIEGSKQGVQDYYDNQLMGANRRFGRQRGTLDKVIDVAGGAAPEIAALMIPGAAVSSGARALGAGATAANIIGDVAAGAYSGIGQSPEEAAIQAGEFGTGGAITSLAGRRFGTLGRIIGGGAGGAAVATAGQIARDNDLSETDTLKNIAIQTAVPVGMELLGGGLRGFGAKPVESVPETNTRQPISPVIDSDAGLRTSPVADESADVFGDLRKFGRNRLDETLNQTQPLTNDLGASTIPEGRGSAPAEDSLVAATRHIGGGPSAGGTVPERSLSERRKLEEWAAGGGKILPSDYLANFNKIEEGTEHTVHLNPETGRVVKSTYPDKFGTSNRGESWLATPSDYLERMQLHNQIFGDDVQLEGVVLKDGKLQVVTSQSHIKGETPTPQEVSEYLKSKGFQEVNLGGVNEWHNSQVGVLASDAKPENFIKTPDGSIVPIDLVVSPISNEGLANLAAKQSQGLRKLGRKSESGAISQPLAQALGSASAGAIIGSASDSEDRAGGALRGALIGLGAYGAAKGLRKLGSKEAFNAGTQAEKGNKTRLGSAVRSAEQQAKLNRSSELDTIMQQAEGTKNLFEQRNNQAFGLIGNSVGKLSTSDRSLVDQFIQSPGGAADIAAIKSSRLPDNVKEGLLTLKGSQREMQEIIGGGDPSKAAMIQATLGTYLSNQYKIFTNPKAYQMDEALIDQVANEHLESPAFTSIKGQPGALEIVKDQLREHIGELQREGGFSNASQNRISRSLFIPKKELTEAQWGALKGLAGDARLTPHEQMAINNMVTSENIRPADQNSIRQIAEGGALNDVETKALLEIANKQVLSKAHKQLLGVVDDPYQRQLLTNAKLLSSLKSAAALPKIAIGRNERGRLALTNTEWQTAMNNAAAKGDKAEIQRLQSYMTAPDSPQLGIMRGQRVQREVMDELVKAPETWLEKNTSNAAMKAAGQYLRSVFTRWNPSAWTHNIAQLPTQAMAAGVNPLDLVKYAMRLKNDKAFKEELVAANMLDVHAGTTFGDGAKTFEETINPRRLGKVRQAYDKFSNALNKGYGYTDQLLRAAAYGENKAEGLALGGKKGLSGDALDEFAKQHAITQTNRYTYNYGNQARIVKTLRDIPLVNTFLPYTVETLRIMKNLADDVLNGDSTRKIRGVKRLSAMLALPTAAATAIEAGMSGDESEEFKRMKKLMPAWMRGRMQVGLGRNERGDIESFNLTPWTQAGDIVATAQSLLRGDFDAFMESNPFFGLQKTPALNILSEQITGRETFTGRKLTTAGDRAMAIARNTLPSLTPGVGYAARRLSKGFADNAEGGTGLTDSVTGQAETPGSAIAATFGFSKSVNNERRLTQYAKRNAGEEIAAEKAKLKDVLRMNLPEAQKQEARKLFIQRKQEINRRLSERLK